MALLHYDLVDLRLFMNVAEAGSLTRGAERTFISTGAASMRIKNLEQSLQTKLLVRRNQGMELTAAGEVLHRHAIEVFRTLERMHGELQAYAKGLKGHLRIFANTTAITEILPEMVGRFMASHPQVDIELEERLSSEIARAVIDGTVDIGILAGNIQTDGLEMRPFQQDRLVVAVPAGHLIAAKGRIEFCETLSFNFVSLHRDSAIHDFLAQIAAELGAELNIRIRVSGFEAMIRMIEADVGIGVLPASVAHRMKDNHRIATIDLVDDWARRELRICAREFDDLPEFARELVDFLIDESSKIQLAL